MSRLQRSRPKIPTIGAMGTVTERVTLQPTGEDNRVAEWIVHEQIDTNLCAATDFAPGGVYWQTARGSRSAVRFTPVPSLSMLHAGERVVFDE